MLQPITLIRKWMTRLDITNVSAGLLFVWKYKLQTHKLDSQLRVSALFDDELFFYG